MWVLCHVYASLVSSTHSTWLKVALIPWTGAYALSLAPIFYTLISELFSPASRPLAAGVATAVTFAAGSAMDMCFLSLRDALTYRGVFIVFAVVCIIGGVGVLVLLPETKGKSLTEVQALIASRRICWCCQGNCGGLGSSTDADDVALEVGLLEEQEVLHKRSSSAFVLAS